MIGAKEDGGLMTEAWDFPEETDTDLTLVQEN